MHSTLLGLKRGLVGGSLPREVKPEGLIVRGLHFRAKLSSVVVIYYFSSLLIVYFSRES